MNCQDPLGPDGLFHPFEERSFSLDFLKFETDGFITLNIGTFHQTGKYLEFYPGPDDRSIIWRGGTYIFISSSGSVFVDTAYFSIACSQGFARETSAITPAYTISSAGYNNHSSTLIVKLCFN